MSDQKNGHEPELTGHDYDGIEEYDNPLPTWWMVTFLGTIIFAFIYWIHYSFGGPSLATELTEAMTVIEAQQAAHASKALTGDELIQAVKDADLAVGAEQFSSKCSACHGVELQGLIGPNLTDAFWIHGKGDIADLVHVIKVGVPEKGMPPWGAALTEQEVVALVALIESKQDSNPAGAKPAQGEKVR